MVHPIHRAFTPAKTYAAKRSEPIARVEVMTPESGLLAIAFNRILSTPTARGCSTSADETWKQVLQRPSKPRAACAGLNQCMRIGPRWQVTKGCSMFATSVGLFKHRVECKTTTSTAPWTLYNPDKPVPNPKSYPQIRLPIHH